MSTPEETKNLQEIVNRYNIKIEQLIKENKALREYIQNKLAVQMRQLIAEYQATTDFAIHLLARYEKRTVQDSEALIKHNAVMRSQPYEVPK